MAVSFGFGGAVNLVTFSDDIPGSDARRLTAAVVWRGDASTRIRGWRRLLRRLRFRFGPLGHGIHFGSTGGNWRGGSGMDGEHETLLHDERRIVRVLGRDYPLPPDGRTLVLLIDDTVSPAQVTVRTLAAPTVTRPPIEHMSPGEELEEAMAEAHRNEDAAWEAALRADPEVQAFTAPLPGQ